MAISFGDSLDRAILAAAGVDPDAVQQGTLTIDAIPDAGPATVRYRVTTTVDSDQLRALICEAVQPPAIPSTPTASEDPTPSETPPPSDQPQEG